MKKFRVYYVKTTSTSCYIEVLANDESDASDKAQELLVENDSSLIELPESHSEAIDEIGEVYCIDDDNE